MAIRFASWVHGNAVTLEQEVPERGSIFSFRHVGWGIQARIRPGFGGWFHVPIPTPVIVDERRLKLVRAFLLFAIENRGSLEYLHLYDGQRLVTKRYKGQNQDANDLLRIRGVHHTELDHLNTFELESPAVAEFGFGLSFYVNADGYAGGGFIDDKDAAILTVSAAGGDFDVA